MRKQKTIHIPKVLVVGIIILISYAFLSNALRDYIPMSGDVKLKPGRYVLAGTNSEISVSDHQTLQFRNFDLNKEIRVGYGGLELNEVFDNKEVKYEFHTLGGPVYNVECRITSYDTLVMEYYSREDKLCLRCPGTIKEFEFVLE